MPRPTPKDVWDWFKECEEHMKSCLDPDCELYAAFARFLHERRLE